jgi:dihydrofolate reductase
MRDLIVTAFTSLDGVIQSPGGEPGYAHAGWVGPYFSDELGAYKFQEQNAAETLLLGRTTYESFYGAWPDRAGDPMADKINAMEKFVASTTLGTSPWTNTSVISDDLEGAVAALKAKDGGPILIAGSRSIATQLLTAGLVDQLNLQVFPLILGSGLRLYPESPDAYSLELESSTSTGNGVLMQEYRVLNS